MEDGSNSSRLEALEEAMAGDKQMLKDILSQLDTLQNVFAARTEKSGEEANSPDSDEAVGDEVTTVNPSDSQTSVSSLLVTKKKTVTWPDQSREGLTLLSNEGLHRVLSSLAVAMGPGQRSTIVQQLAAESLLTSTQLASILSHLRLAAEREDGARRLAPCIVDSENCADALLPVFSRLPRHELRRVLQCAMMHS